MSKLKRGAVRAPSPGRNNSPGPISPHSRLVPQEQFRRTIYLEQKRTERSRRHFVLMLVSCEDLTPPNQSGALAKIHQILVATTRETDTIGWYNEGSSLGVIFTELGESTVQETAATLASRMKKVVEEPFAGDGLGQLRVTFHLFPDDWDENGSDLETRSALYESYPPAGSPSGFSLMVKRLIDIVGSSTALVVLSPLMLAIAIAVKMTSEGPVLFRQQRVGRFGKRFEFLKFRSMRQSNDSTVHKEYVKQFIAGQAPSANGASNGTPLFKLVNDNRITKLGKFLRRSSLDELPQFINVLRGEMSLVGPRPPIPYEVENYDIWHKRRLLAVKPGITGLWQVSGRSRTKFDEMVRLDLKYATSWSIGLDLKILLKTPGAVLSRDGAY